MGKSGRGFTLVEVLVVVALVSVLATAIVIAINPAKRIGQAYDSQRKSALASIARALQVQYVDRLAYPDPGVYADGDGLTHGSDSTQTDFGGFWIPLLVPDYLKTLPNDPKQGGGPSSLPTALLGNFDVMAASKQKSLGRVAGDFTSSFVTRVGNQLMLGGQPFKFSGPNIPQLALWGGWGSGPEYQTNFEITDAIETAKEMGATVIRSHTLGISLECSKCIEPSLGTFNDDAFGPIEFAIKTARDNGIRLIIPLVDDHDFYYHGIPSFLYWRGYERARTGPDYDRFYTDPVIIQDYKNYIAHILNHVNPLTGLALKDDPTIMAWETGNELNNKSYKWDATNVAWTQNIADYLKSLSPNILVLDGHHSSANTKLLSCTTCAATNVNIPSVDIYQSHVYAPGVRTQNATLAADGSFFKTKGKVFIVGEYDWTETSDDNGGNTLQDILSVVENPTYGISGDLWWQLSGHADDDGFYTGGGIYRFNYTGQTPDIETRGQILRTHAYAMSGITAPSHKIPSAPVLRPITGTNNNISVKWQGVVAAKYYHVERSSDNGITWVVVKSDLTDHDSPWIDTAGKTTDKYRIRAFNLDDKAGCYSGGCGIPPGGGDPILSCSPDNQSVQTGDNASLTAVNGDTTSIWSASGGNPASGTGVNFSVSFSSAGSKNVGVKSGDGSQQDTCVVDVTSSGGDGEPPQATGPDFKYLYVVDADLQHFTLWATLEDKDDKQIHDKANATCKKDPPTDTSYNYCIGD